MIGDEKIDTPNYVNEILGLGVILPSYDEKGELTELSFHLSDLLTVHALALDDRPGVVGLLSGKKRHRQELERSAMQSLEHSITDIVQSGKLKNDYDEIQEYKRIKAGASQNPKILKLENQLGAECFYRTSVFTSLNLLDQYVFTADIKKTGDTTQVIYEHHQTELLPDGKIQRSSIKTIELYDDYQLAHTKALQHLKIMAKVTLPGKALDQSSLSFEVVEKSS